MKYGKLLVVLVALSAIFLFSCSSSKTTNPEDKFLEELAKADYVVGIVLERYLDIIRSYAFITYYSDNPARPQATMRFNGEVVEIEWEFYGDVWSGYIDQTFNFWMGDNVNIQLSTPSRTSNQTITLPFRPNITNTDFPPIAHTDFNLSWQLNQNAYLQIVMAEGYIEEGWGEYNEVINRSHRSHIIPGSTFPANMTGWYVDITNVAWKSSGNHGFISLEWDSRPVDDWDNSQSRIQDIQSRYMKVYQILKNQ